MLVSGVTAQNSGIRKQFRDSTDLEKAEARRETEPQEAIQLLNRSLQNSLDRGDRVQSARAYVLLGQIYEDIGQQELALNRYQQAMPIWNMIKDPDQNAANYNRIGRMQLALGQMAAAELSFQQCLDLPASAGIHLVCREGLGDAQRQAGAFKESEVLYNAVNEAYTLNQDSIGMARVSAKRSRNFLENAGDLANAKASYNKSIQVLPEDVPSASDYEAIEEARNALDDAIQNYEDQRDLSRQTILEQGKRSLPPEVKIREQLQLANLELEEGEVEAADDRLDSLDQLFTAAINPAAAVEVHKLRSEVKLQKGDYQSAVEAYQEYVKANEQRLADQQSALKQQSLILKEQGEVDLSVKDFLLRQSEQNLLRSQLRGQRWIIGLLILLLLAAVVSFIVVRRQEKSRQKAYQLLGLKSLRTQMNPHFIFNALNSINNYIAQQDERSANKFLSDFSRLMRMVLEYSQKDFILFSEEMQLLELYLKLEHARFGDQFDYSISEASGLDLADVEVPPMLLQPFVENAIWHGLRYKKEKGRLHLTISQDVQQQLVIKISDNGIGRRRSKLLKTKRQSQYQSTGLSNVHQRIELINTLYEKQYTLSIDDLDTTQEDEGTVVTLSFLP